MPATHAIKAAGSHTAHYVCHFDTCDRWGQRAAQGMHTTRVHRNQPMQMWHYHIRNMPQLLHPQLHAPADRHSLCHHLLPVGPSLGTSRQAGAAKAAGSAALHPAALQAAAGWHWWRVPVRQRQGLYACSRQAGGCVCHSACLASWPVGLAAAKYAQEDHVAVCTWVLLLLLQGEAGPWSR